MNLFDKHKKMYVFKLKNYKLKKNSDLQIGINWRFIHQLTGFSPLPSRQANCVNVSANGLIISETLQRIIPEDEGGGDSDFSFSLSLSLTNARMYFSPRVRDFTA